MRISTAVGYFSTELCPERSADTPRLTSNRLYLIAVNVHDSLQSISFVNLGLTKSAEIEPRDPTRTAGIPRIQGGQFSLYAENLWLSRDAKMGIEILMANLSTSGVIPSGGSTTQTLFSDGLTIVGIAIPTLSSAADVTLLVSSDGGTTFQTFDTASLQPFKFTNLTAGNCYWSLDPNAVTGIETFQIQTIDHVANTAVTQTPGVTFTIHFREFR